MESADSNITRLEEMGFPEAAGAPTMPAEKLSLDAQPVTLDRAKEMEAVAPTMQESQAVGSTRTVGATVSEPWEETFKLKKIHTSMLGFKTSIEEKLVTITIYPKKSWSFIMHGDTSRSKGIIGTMVYKGKSRYLRDEEIKVLFICNATEVQTLSDEKIRLNYAYQNADEIVPLADGQTYKNEENAERFIDLINKKIPAYLKSQNFDTWRSKKWDEENAEIMSFNSHFYYRDPDHQSKESTRVSQLLHGS